MSGFYKKRLSQGLLILVLAVCNTAPANADKNYDEGLKLFNKKDYKKAAAYFEQSITSVPWESGPYYYCALSYHYMKDYKKASAQYAAIIDKFPGTQASQNATAALKVVDPGYFKRARATDVQPVASQQQTQSTSSSKDTGSVEGNPSRVYFSKSGRDMVVDIRVNGRAIKAILDPTAEHSIFSKGQLQALSIPVQPGANEHRVDLQIGQLTRKNFPISVENTAAAQPRIGQSFLEAFSYTIDNAGSWMDIQKKSGAAGGHSGGSSDLSFRKSGKDIMVTVDVNGRSMSAIFDPNIDGVVIPARVGKSLGLPVDEAEEVKPLPSEGPQRGEAGWVNPDDRPAGPKQLVVRRMKFGPVERQNVSVQVTDSKTASAKVGADFAVGWRCDVDYKANVIHFNKR